MRKARDPLGFPDWMPPYVRDFVQIIYTDTNSQEVCPKDVELLRRLTTDPRMERVWNELLRKTREDHKSTEQYMHPVSCYYAGKSTWSFRARLLQSRAAELSKKGKYTEAARTQIRAALFAMEVPDIFNRLMPLKLSLQARGLTFLFHTTFCLARQAPWSVSVFEIRKAGHEYRMMAKRARADAAHDHRLLEASLVYNELAEDAIGPLGTTLAVDRKPRGDARLRGFVMALASTTKAIFGAPLYGTVATLTNVALDRADVTAPQVRQMASSHTLSLTDGSEGF